VHFGEIKQMIETFQQFGSLLKGKQKQKRWRALESGVPSEIFETKGKEMAKGGERRTLHNEDLKLSMCSKVRYKPTTALI
jgi:hypothetical protein